MLIFFLLFNTKNLSFKETFYSMATVKQKTWCTLLGMAVGGVTGYLLAEKEEDRLAYTLSGAALGGLGGYGFAHLLKEPCDTVNYSCFDGKKRVYEGICYEDRKEIRMSEHESNGKVFTHVHFSNTKPRSQALVIEKKRIQRHKPKYNIQHKVT
jgi:hypothetical protein